MPGLKATGYSKILKTLLPLTLLLLIFMAGCKKSAVVGESPTIVSDPIDKAADVVLNKVIAITFSADMDATTINDKTFTLKQGTTAVAGTVAATSSAKTFTFTPAAALLPYTVYTGTITTGAADTYHMAIPTDYTFSFTTIAAVTVSSNPAIGGTTTGATGFAQGSLATVAATPSTGYTFLNWTNNGTIVSTSSTYQFTMAGNKTLVANFSAIPAGQLALVLTANPIAGGTNAGSGAYSPGTNVTVAATANTGYTFTNWTENGVIASTTSSYSFALTAKRTLVANYTLNAIAGMAALNLGTSGDFAILTKAGISTTGVTLITGNIGTSPIAATSITGFGLIMDTDGTSSHTPIVIGKVYAADYTAPTPAKMTTAISDMETAFSAGNALTSPAPVVELYAGDISGKTIASGLYKWGTGVLITSAGVTLNGGPNDVWVFQIAQDLTVNNSAIISLTGGAQAKNVFWIVSGKATLGTNTNFSGVILSKTLISLSTGAKVKGRLLAQTAVTLDAATVTQP